MDEKRHVRKSNIFIEGRYRFGIHEQRILLSIISKIKISDTDFQPYRIQWNYFKNLTKNQFKNASDINSLCEKLKNKTVLIKEKEKIHGFGFLSGWTIEPSKWVEFRIDPCMRGMLLNLLQDGNFTLYKLECVLSLGSAYSVRLYELLKACEWKSQPVEMKLVDLKWKLGVKEGSLIDKRFNLFRTQILEKAKKDIEKHTDIKFTYKKILELRKVVALQLYISENKNYQHTIPSLALKKTMAKDGDTLIIDGKEYLVEYGCVRYNNGTLPIGRINQLLKKGVINKKC